MKVLKDPRDLLHVYYANVLVGRIWLNEASQMEFGYSDDWLQNKVSFPISMSMPLINSPISASTSHNFFANLLPEANVRTKICRKLKISPGNDFGLLQAIGGDCAGALSIVNSDVPRARHKSYQDISPEQLADWSIGTPDAFSAVTGQEGIRLSLAGAQDKLPVRFDGTQFFLPMGDASSTHLLKFASPFYSHLPENETLTTMLASTLGLPVVDVCLLAAESQTKSSAFVVIGRYDRQGQGDQWTRLHQEDFCQALGISASNKYEKEGGPSLRQCSEIIKQHCSIPAIEIDKLLRWSVFNLLAGNSDAHGKNLSILFGDSGSITLAPFYDLLCTRNYENLDPHLAMRIGGESDPGLINGDHWRTMAEDIGATESLVLDTVTEMATSLSKLLPLVIEEFQSRYGESPVLERLPLKINQQIRRTLYLV